MFFLSAVLRRLSNRESNDKGRQRRTNEKPKEALTSDAIQRPSAGLDHAATSTRTSNTQVLH